MKKIRVTIEATAIMPDYLARRMMVKGKTRDKKELAKMVLDDSKNDWTIEVEELQAGVA